MPKKRTHCENKRCRKRLTAYQISRDYRFCSQPCGRTDKSYKRWNQDPVQFETPKRGNEEW